MKHVKGNLKLQGLRILADLPGYSAYPIAMVMQHPCINGHDDLAAQRGADMEIANAVELVRRWNLHEKLVEALKEISEGRGRYSMDNYQFACNCIDDMKALAVAALKLAREGM